MQGRDYRNGDAHEDGDVSVADTAEAAAEMRRILVGLPQPEPDVAAALADGVEGPELDALIR